MGHPYQPMSHSPEDGMEKGGWGGGCAVIFICQDHCTHKLTTATVTCAEAMPTYTEATVTYTETLVTYTIVTVTYAKAMVSYTVVTVTYTEAVAQHQAVKISQHSNRALIGLSGP